MAFERTRVRERDPSDANTYERSMAFQLALRERSRTAKVVIKGSERPMEESRQGFLKYFNSRLSGLRMKMIVERICPQNHPWTHLIVWFTLAEPLLKRLRSEDWNAAFRRNTCYGLRHITKQGCLGKKIRDTRQKRTKSCPPVDQAH